MKVRNAIRSPEIFPGDNQEVVTADRTTDKRFLWYLWTVREARQRFALFNHFRCPSPGMVVKVIIIIFQANRFLDGQSVVMRNYISKRITTFTTKPDFLKRRRIFFLRTFPQKYYSHGECEKKSGSAFIHFFPVRSSLSCPCPHE
jgi:hypothetical protein